MSFEVVFHVLSCLFSILFIFFYKLIGRVFCENFFAKLMKRAIIRKTFANNNIRKVIAFRKVGIFLLFSQAAVCFL